MSLNDTYNILFYLVILEMLTYLHHNIFLDQTYAVIPTI